jgi:DNA-binding NarL/FixJ family response regulator
MMKTLDFRAVDELRSCFRCGADFRDDGRSRICSGCRQRTAGNQKALNPRLSFREKQVVSLVSQAKLNKEIAHELHLTEGTVKEYLNRIFRKLGKSNRTELAVWALTHETHDLQDADECVA